MVTLLWKESLNSDSHQLHQYQQNEQSPLVWNHWMQKKKTSRHMMLEIQFFLAWHKHKTNVAELNLLMGYPSLLLTESPMAINILKKQSFRLYYGFITPKTLNNLFSNLSILRILDSRNASSTLYLIYTFLLVISDLYLTNGNELVV